MLEQDTNSGYTSPCHTKSIRLYAPASGSGWIILKAAFHYTQNYHAEERTSCSLCNRDEEQALVPKDVTITNGYMAG